MPEGSELRRSALADVDGDGRREIVVSFAAPAQGGLPSGMAVGVADWDGQTYSMLWQSKPLAGERDEGLVVQDVNSDGRLEILSTQSMGAAGQTLYLFRWDGTDYRQLGPVGGALGGTGSFGAVGVRIQDLDSDGAMEILSAYGPAGIYADIYQWGGSDYRFARTVALTGPTSQASLEQPALPGLIVFSRRGNLWSIRPDGSDLQQITTGSFDIQPSFSPDGSRIAFLSTDAILVEEGPPTPTDVRVVGRDGGEPVQVTDRTAGQTTLHSRPSWSPDGLRLTYNEGGRLVVINADGSDRRVLSERAALTGLPAATDAYWSPSEETVLFAQESGADLPALALADVPSGQTRSVGEGLVVLYGWLPGGEAVWYASWEDLGLWVVDVVSGDVQKLLEDASIITSLAWSPDGSRLAYAVKGELWMLEVATGQAHRLGKLADPDPSGRYELLWSPEGHYLLYSVAYEEGQGLWLVSADGQRQWRLTDGPDTMPDWSSR